MGEMVSLVLDPTVKDAKAMLLESEMMGVVGVEG